MESSESIGVYGEAKAEYTRQLCIFLVPALENYFLDLLEETKTEEKDTRRVLWAFQDKLKQFPDWNIDKVQRETEKISTSTKCDYLEEILTAVFIAHTKVLSAIRLTSKQKKLQITIPKLDHFLHRTMSECARQLWSNAYLFAENGSSIERQKNLRQVEQLLHEAVLQSIRGMLPVKSILKEYLNDDGEEGPEEATAGGASIETHTDEPVVQTEETPAPAQAEVSEEKKEGEKPLQTSLEEKKEEPVVAPIVEQKMEEVKQEEIQAPVLDLSGVPVPAPVTPTIIVDTEPASVSFTERDAIFDSDNPDKSTIRMFAEGGGDHDDNDGGYVDSITIDESAAPEAVDDFEDLMAPSEMDESAVDGFETL